MIFVFVHLATVGRNHVETSSPYEFIGFSIIDANQPSNFIGFLSTYDGKPYEIILFWGFNMFSSYWMSVWFCMIFDGPNKSHYQADQCFLHPNVCYAHVQCLCQCLQLYQHIRKVYLLYPMLTLSEPSLSKRRLRPERWHWIRKADGKHREGVFWNTVGRKCVETSNPYEHKGFSIIDDQPPYDFLSF